MDTVSFTAAAGDPVSDSETAAATTGDDSEAPAAAGVPGSAAAPTAVASKVLSVMQAFMQKHGVSFDRMVKHVFYYMIKFEGKCEQSVRLLSTELFKQLVEAGLSAPVQKAAQKKTKV